MDNFLIPLSRRQEEFSKAWLMAVAAVAGYSIDITNVDVDGIDARIVQVSNKNCYPKGELINVQLKCSYSCTPKKDGIHFPLSVRTYNKLRSINLVNPRILLILHVPRKNSDWLSHLDDKMILQHCAYWTSLKGRPETSNRSDISVIVPQSRKFTVDQLKKMMNLVAKGEQLEGLLR
jgi:hypothetical protein